MPTRDDAAQGSRVVISAVIHSIADGALEIGAATPIVAPLCTALLKAKKVVDGASSNGEELAELHKSCDLITVQVIEKARALNTSAIDVSPLQECVDKLAVVSKRYHDQGRFAKLAQFRRDGDDIKRLRDRIGAVVPIMGLAGIVDLLVRQPSHLMTSRSLAWKTTSSQPQQQTVVSKGGIFSVVVMSIWYSTHD